MSMSIESKSSTGTTMVPIESRLLGHRCIELSGAIDDQLVERVFEQLTYLLLESPKAPVKVFINSPGGSVDAGLVLLDMFTTCGAPVEMYCLTQACSMAALIFAAGKHGRYMLPSSKVMIHEPLIGANRGGSASDIASLSKDLTKTAKRLNKILAEATGKTEKQIAKETSYDHFFSAEEAVEFGLCDEVVDFQRYMEVSE